MCNNVYFTHRHVYDRQDEYRAWVRNVAPMENVMKESQHVIVLFKCDVYKDFLIAERAGHFWALLQR